MDDRIAGIKSRLHKPVVIVGMMGAGKSHLGRKLAGALGLDFFDSDSLVEQKAGRPVSEIFQDFGEARFRESEKITILEILDHGPCVLATGGGAVADPQTLEAIKSRAISIWLKANIEETLARIGDGHKRPMLQGGDPETILRDLMAKREPFYAQADIVVETMQGSVAASLEKLTKALYSHLNAVSF
jgi:shikimate kinase